MVNRVQSIEKPTGPLAGLRILDLSRILAGPYCTQLLGDMGADVIKVERPGAGDDTRSWGPPYVTDATGVASSESAYYLSANRNKRSIAVDIATAEGLAIVKELLGTCDVLVENFKVGGLARYGLSYDDLQAEHPGLVYCSITGFGQTGPNAHRAGYDLLAQGFGGIMSLTGIPEGEPMKVGVGICDVMTGMYAATSILAALRHRDATGEGQQIDLALVDVQTSWLVNEGTNYLLSGELPQRRGNQHPNIVPYQVFEVSDGHVIVAVGNDGQFARFCTILGCPDLAADPHYATNPSRLENREALIALLTPLLRQQQQAPLLTAMEARGVPGGPINQLDQVFDSDQVRARDMKVSVPHPKSGTGTVDLIGNPAKFSQTPVNYRRAPPLCGADSEEILDEMAELRSAAASA
ncbi:CaiB/BaiF CoA transferase family protein [Parasedimentitalea maritima]|uniref:CaiB/BaiF CoA transferase family protein n=1 Tax=Parasedimentitalea maritima TaxID=2578117 RepID=UPI001FD7D54C|nr:CaiB/BaiF CoA-transferase family protein [Zongyanglinia marina]